MVCISGGVCCVFVEIGREVILISFFFLLVVVVERMVLLCSLVFVKATDFV